MRCGYLVPPRLYPVLNALHYIFTIHHTTSTSPPPPPPLPGRPATSLTVKSTKNFWLFSPTQLLTQGQWWSIFRIHLWQTEQWCARSGLMLQHFGHWRRWGGRRRGGSGGKVRAGRERVLDRSKAGLGHGRARYVCSGRELSLGTLCVTSAGCHVGTSQNYLPTPTGIRNIVTQLIISISAIDAYSYIPRSYQKQPHVCYRVVDP